jgi:D-threo-aldose 1-dehydrogenase
VNTRKVRGLALTELGFGGASLGNLYRATTDEQARAAVDAAWDGGVRYYDTAPHYGLGLSETRLGAALADRPRDAYVLSTKVGRLLEPNPDPTGSDMAAGGFDVVDTLRRRFDFSAAGVRRSLESSLERLGVDRVDIAYVHDPDAYVDDAITEAIPELVRMRDEGTIGAVGVGMNQWPAPLRMVEETDLDVVMLAGRWTLLDRTGQRLLDACARSGVAVVAAAPFNSGLLAVDRPADGAYFDYGPASPDVLARARALAETCRRNGVTLPVAALQFPLRHPVVASVVCGMRTAEQVESTLERFSAGIPESAWPELDGDLHD